MYDRQKEWAELQNARTKADATLLAIQPQVIVDDLYEYKDPDSEKTMAQMIQTIDRRKLKMKKHKRKKRRKLMKKMMKGLRSI